MQAPVGDWIGRHVFLHHPSLPPVLPAAGERGTIFIFGRSLCCRLGQSCKSAHKSYWIINTFTQKPWWSGSLLPPARTSGSLTANNHGFCNASVASSGEQNVFCCSFQNPAHLEAVPSTRRVVICLPQLGRETCPQPPLGLRITVN